MSNLRARLAIGLVRATGSLPFSVCRLLGKSMGSVAYYCNTRMAKVTYKNISICLPHIPEKERGRFTLRSLQETGKTVTETCFVWQHTIKSDHPMFERCEGEEHVVNALSKSKGLLVIAPHLGNWEALGQFLLKYAQVTNLYQPPKLQGFDSIIIRGRTRTGSKLAPTNTKGVATVLKALKNNEICGILPDQNPNDQQSGAFASFFNEPAFTMTLIHKLIQKTQCAAVFAFAKRTRSGFTIVFRPAPEKLFSDNQEESLQALNTGIENLVREAPEQYQWEYKRFKVQNPARPVRHYS